MSIHNADWPVKAGRRDGTYDAQAHAQAIRQALQCHRPGCECHRPNGRVHCPAHDDANPSFSVTVRNGRLLVHCLAGCTQDVAIEALRRRDLWLAQQQTPRRTIRVGNPIPSTRAAVPNGTPDTTTGSFPTAQQAVQELERRHGKRSATWIYHDADGNPVGLVLRWDRDDGGKDIRPVSRHGDVWRIGAMPEPRPLYRLPDLASADRVIVTEGEKAADAARSLGFVATTSAGGAQAPSKTDWQPLAGKEVWILPDNDTPGRKYAEAVADLLLRLHPVPTVRIVELPGLPVGGDIVDWIATLHGDAAEPDGMRAEIEALATKAQVLAQNNDIWPELVPLCPHDVPPFPTHALPDWLRAFVEAEAQATQTPADLAGMLTLAILAVCCQKKCIVRVRDGWSEPLNIYTVVALPPGTRKTAVFQDVTAPLEDWERAEIERLAPEVAVARSKHRIAEQRLQALQAKAAKAQPDEAAALMGEAAQLAEELATANVPALPRLLADDCTPEALARLLAEQGGRLGVFSDEGDVFDLMRARYGNAPNFGVYLRAHSGSALRVDRVGRKPEYVPAPALSIGLAVQPDVVRGLTEEKSLRGRGLLARFLYSWPAHSLGQRDPEAPPLPEMVRATYHGGVNRLLQLPMGTAPDGREAPHVLTLGPDAYQRLMAFQRWLEPQLGESGELVAIADWAAKLAGEIVRMAGLLHLAEHCTLADPWHRPIGLPTMEAAVTLGEYLLAHARYTFAEMGADRTIAAARYLLRRIEDVGMNRFTRRDIWRWTMGHFHTVEDLKPALEMLCEHGYIRECPAHECQGPGRRPSPTYEVNPLYLNERGRGD